MKKKSISELIHFFVRHPLQNSLQMKFWRWLVSPADAEDKEEIVYTKGSTEAINLVAAVLREQIKPGDNIVTTELEHSSNYFPWKELCEKQELISE